MSKSGERFEATLLRPADSGENEGWGFLILPKEASDTLPRRGRTTVRGTLNGQPFQATLDPDGRLSHWLRVDEELRRAANADFDTTVALELSAVVPEPEPRVPPTLSAALTADPKAKAEWDSTTTIARLDWIHWIESAKQQRTRDSRLLDACEMLASGKGRVCCFDQSGYYSKSQSPPKAAG